MNCAQAEPGGGPTTRPAVATSGGAHRRQIASSTVAALKRYFELSKQRSNVFIHLEEKMKSIFKLSVAALLVCATSAFAVTTQTTPPATSATATAAQSTPVVKETRAERKAEKKQIEANEKTAMAECKKLKGAEKKECKKQAEAQEKTATAELKAKK